MGKRQFDQCDERAKVWLLVSALQMAWSEPEEMRKKWRTDVYGIAIQYRPLLKREDFDLIKNKTFDEVMQILAK